MDKIVVTKDFFEDYVSKIGDKLNITDNGKIISQSVDFIPTQKLLDLVGMEVEEYDPYDDYHQTINACFSLENGKYTVMVYDDFETKEIELKGDLEKIVVLF